MAESGNNKDVVLVQVKPRHCIGENGKTYLYPDTFQTTRERARSLDVVILSVVKPYAAFKSTIKPELKARLDAVVEKAIADKKGAGDAAHAPQA